jgi:hypothetical protein
VPNAEQLVPLVCGGLGSLHAIALPSFGGSRMQSVACERPHESERGGSRVNAAGVE